MTVPAPLISPLSEKHLRDVAYLHLTYLRTPFRGYAGQRMLMCYYRVLADAKGGCGYVAEEDGNLVGYVCGVWNAKDVRRALLKMHMGRLILWGLLQSITNPEILLHFVSKLRIRSCEGVPHASLFLAGYELRPIVVQPDKRGTGVALQLVRRLMRDAKERNFDRVFLCTEHDNVRANNFYRKLGFREIGVRCVGPTAYNYYEIYTDQKLYES